MVFLKLSQNPYICFGLQPDHHQGVTSYRLLAGNPLMMVWLQTETYVEVFRQFKKTIKWSLIKRAFSWL
jgi:hypothetical protein